MASKLTIQNLIKRTDAIQAQLSLGALTQAGRTAQDFQQLTESLSNRIRESSRTAASILKKLNHTPADLPVRSRRAYQWLAFLSEAPNLEDHLDALLRVNLFLPQLKRLPRLRSLQVEFLFYHLGAVYKINQERKNLQISVQEAFIRAPDKVLIAFLETVLGEHRQRAQAIIRDHTFTESYQRERTQLEYLGIPPASYSHGKAHDLEVSFTRVNRDYFQGKLPPPYLSWTDRMTYRKFGHYQWDTDTVMISQTLDQDSVPAFVVDYVMYHELLHKQHGLRRVNDRRMAHTSRFRRAENGFSQIHDAKNYLNQLARKKS